jgi:hypothetical protein
MNAGPTAQRAVVADLLEEQGLERSRLFALVQLLEHDGCWGCVPGTPSWAADEHLHTVPDRALAVFLAAKAARAELRAVAEVVPPG